MGLALSVAALLLSALAVALAIYSCFASRAAMKRHGTTSLRVELDELRDSFEKNSALLKRISQRTVMQERREAASSQASDDADGGATQRKGESVADWKRRMRAQLIHPGKPTRHN